MSLNWGRGGGGWSGKCLGGSGEEGEVYKGPSVYVYVTVSYSTHM